jgi:hypothetical protein
MRTVILTALITLTFTAPINGQLVIPLTEGENYISINVYPPDEMYREDEDRGPDLVLMFEQIADHVLIIRDEYGNFYIPSWDNYCLIDYWHLTKCYLVTVDEDVEFVIDGEPIPADADIPLHRGQNFIAYFPDYELDASAPDFYVLSPIIDFVESAQDFRGGEMNPGENFSNMEPWRPGRGYIVIVSEDVILNYPAEQDVKNDAFGTPVTFGLMQNYPNPFNSTTTIRYNLHKPDMVNIQIFDQSGKYIRTIFNGQQNTGQHCIVWDAGGLPSGNYIFILKNGNQVLAAQGSLIR